MRATRPCVLPVVLALCASGGQARAAFIDSNLAVSATAHMNGGGCYPVSISPGLLDMLALVDPEWAPVDPGTHLPPVADPVAVHGSVALAKINESGDFSADHTADDQNTFIEVDPSDMGLVATGNVGPQGVETGSMEVEWEIAKYPLFAWAGVGDRFTVVGRWIWDCGHPLPNPAGTCSTTTTQACVIDGDCAAPLCSSCVSGETCQNVVFNYHSELHPPQAVAVSRVGRGYRYSRKVKGGRLSTRTDVWISPDGGGAADDCALTHRPNVLSLLNVDCSPFSRQLADANASNFEFDIPLPPRPAGRTKPPRVRVFDRTPAKLPKPAVTTTFVDGPTPVVHASVDMTTPINGVLPSRVGKAIVAGWRGDHTPFRRVRIKVTAIEILNPLKAVTPTPPLKQRCSLTTMQDCSLTPCPAGETCLSLGGPTPGWQVFLEANGDWRQLTGLENVSSPTTVPQSLAFDTAMPITGGTLNLHATGKSLACLESQLYGLPLPRALALYGLTDGAACLASLSKDIGAFNLSFGPPDFGSGPGTMDHVVQSVGGDGGTCSATTSQLCVGDADCPMGEMCDVTGGSFKLHFTITKRR